MALEIFKFGGASVKDATAVKNIVQVLKQQDDLNKVIIISAMGKTTNALEHIIDAYFNTKRELPKRLQALHEFHTAITDQLFTPNHAIYDQITELFAELKGFLAWNKSPHYDFVYDQVVCYGELLSTTIVSAYLHQEGLQNTWLDARTLVQTDTRYRDAYVDWETTQKAIQLAVPTKGLSITQGFIGSDPNNFSTTLGREGSDYTGAIFAYCLNATSLTIWKDVPGVLNGDPRVFKDTTLLHQISYEEAIELAFYGASVIHPKTLQPLQRKEIMLYVKSFLAPTKAGTTVCKGKPLDPEVPCYIVKKNQVLISLSSLDFSFMMEDNIGEVFKLLGQHKMKVDLIQNSAISFSVCVDNTFKNLDALEHQLKAKFKVTITREVSLYTIRHYTQPVLDRFQKNKTVLLKQVAGLTAQLIIQE